MSYIAITIYKDDLYVALHAAKSFDKTNLETLLGEFRLNQANSVSWSGLIGRLSYYLKLLFRSKNYQGHWNPIQIVLQEALGVIKIAQFVDVYGNSFPKWKAEQTIDLLQDGFLVEEQPTFY